MSKYTIHMILVFPEVSTSKTPTSIMLVNISATLMHKSICNCILSDNEGPYLPSVSPAIETRRKTHTATTFSCIIIVYECSSGLKVVLETLCLILSCVIMQGILYLHPRDFDSNSPLNNESNEVGGSALDSFDTASPINLGNIDQSGSVCTS